jgi:cyclopropane fatty-acyl-phospholipid synthase-like methyltransferase
VSQVWNERYGNDTYAYGTSPNEFFKEQIAHLNPGKILLPAEGEGRNAVYAAGLGWEVVAFDQSIEGRKKAILLAEANRVEIEYLVGEFADHQFEENHFNAIGLIFAHFPAEVKSGYHRMLSRYLKKGGLVIFEAFSKNHLSYVAANPKVGGPKDINMLFSMEEIRNDFPDFEILVLEETEIELHEGPFHDGVGSVIRFVGRKK